VSFLARVRERASRVGAQIAFPESDDPRVLEAAVRLARERVARPVLVLDPSSPDGGEAARATGLPCVDPLGYAGRIDAVAGALLRARTRRGLTHAAARRLARDPLACALFLVRSGTVDAAVAGAVRTTRELLKLALWLVGPAPRIRTVSSAFYMVMEQKADGGWWKADDGREAVERAEMGGDVLTFTDCAVVPEPTAAQLAEIALVAADARRRIVGDEPRVAFLSYSTHGSGGDEPSIRRVRAAVARVRRRAPALAVDGELQGDAALVGEVGRRKAPASAVAGHANVLVFPSLDAGNIAYKLTERLAGARAIGPILQGLARPVSDLSRGADADAIFHVAAVTALMARPKNGETGRSEDRQAGTP